MVEESERRRERRKFNLSVLPTEDPRVSCRYVVGRHLSWVKRVDLGGGFGERCEWEEG